MTIKDFLNRGDRFAANAGAQLISVSEGHACAQMEVTAEHLNAGGVCQGGAIFTLADLAFAAVTNGQGQLTFGIESNIAFLHSAQLGDVLVAEAAETFAHHKLPYCEVKVKNQRGEMIAAFTGMAYRTNKTIELEK